MTENNFFDEQKIIISILWFEEDSMGYNFGIYINTEESIIIIEVPDFDWILKHQTYWDITYEHCNYFTMESIKNLFKLKKIDLIDVFNSFSGQYLIVIGKFKSTSALFGRR